MHPPGAVTPQEATPVSVLPQGAILLLDEDSASRKLLRRLLDREGYLVREASDSSAALAELRDTGMGLAIVNLNGHEHKAVVRTLRSAYPDLTVVLLSETVTSAEKSEKMAILPKPSHAFAVLQNIRHLISQDRRPEVTHNVAP
jgi:DNA-binding response OmpR family regulator